MQGMVSRCMFYRNPCSLALVVSEERADHTFDDTPALKGGVVGGDESMRHPCTDQHGVARSFPLVGKGLARVKVVGESGPYGDASER